MSFRNSSLRSLRLGAMLLVVVGSPALAQSFYPSFQQPRVVSREFNVAIADGDHLTPLVFPGREGTAPGTQLSLDLGLADPDNDALETFFMAGGQYARMLTQARADMPLDMLLTVGLFGQFGNDVTSLGVPVGVSVGGAQRLPVGPGRRRLGQQAHDLVYAACRAALAERRPLADLLLTKLQVVKINRKDVLDALVDVGGVCGDRVEDHPQITIRWCRFLACRAV